MTRDAAARDLNTITKFSHHKEFITKTRNFQKFNHFVNDTQFNHLLKIRIKSFEKKTSLEITGECITRENCVAYMLIVKAKFEI